MKPAGRAQPAKRPFNLLLDETTVQQARVFTASLSSTVDGLLADYVARHRVVVPLVSTEMLGRVAQLPSSAVNPVFEVEGVPVVLNPLEIVSVPVEALGELFSRTWS